MKNRIARMWVLLGMCLPASLLAADAGRNPASEVGGLSSLQNATSTAMIAAPANAITSIAILPFAQAAADVDLAAVIEADMASSGRFQVLPRQQQPERPLELKQIDFQVWRALKIQYLVIGSTAITPTQVGARFFLLDVQRGEQMLGFDLPAVPKAQSRYIGHQIADLLYAKLTGRPGSFNTKMAYVAVSSEGSSRSYSLRVADIDGVAPRIVAQSREPLMSPAWSPDRKRLAFVGFARGQSAIYVQTLATGAVRKVFSMPGINAAPAWSADGRRLALACSIDQDVEIFVLDLVSGQQQRLTTSAGIDTEPSWSPDSKSIAFTSDREGQPQIYLMNVDGSEPRRVSIEGRQNLRPAFSPDGSQLAMVQYDGGQYRIALLDVQRKTTRLISAGPLDTSPSFSPNGEALLYAAGESRTLVISGVDAQLRSRIRDAAALTEPAWSPTQEP